MKLWGRGELETLDAAVSRAREGGPAVLIVEGEAGVGKTTLLDELVGRAGGFRTLDADGVENDDAPFGALAQWGVDVRRTLDGGITTPFVAAHDLRDVIDSVNGSSPVLLRLDDLQWADPESVRALTWLLRRAAGDRLLVALATRPTDPQVHAEWSRWVSAPGHAVRIPLTGLTAPDAVTLIRGRQPTLPAEAALLLWEHTSGNPLYLTALLDEHEAPELLRSRVLPAPAEYARLVGVRVDRLPPSGAALLRAVSVIGSTWVSLFDAAAAGEVTDPLRAAQLLTVAALLQTRTVDGVTSVRVPHALVRAAVYQQTPLPHRRALHARVARVVVDESAALEHRVAAADGYDDALADELETAARVLHLGRSHRAAAQHLRWAGALTRLPLSRGRRWLDSLFESLLAQDLEVVRAELDAVARAHDVARRTLVLGALRIMDGRWPDGARILEPVSREPLESVDPLTRYRLEVLLAWARVGAGHDTESIADALDRARAMAADDPAISGYLVFAEGQVAGRRRQRVAGNQRLPDAAALVPLDATYELAWRGVRSLRRGFFDRAVADLTETQRRIRAGLIDIVGDSFHAVLGQAYWMLGEWGLARLHVRLALERSGQVGHPVVLSVVPITDIGDGDLLAADRLLRRAADMLREAPWQEACEFLLITQVIRMHAGSSTIDRVRFFAGVRDVVHDTARAASGTDALWLLHAAMAAVWAGEPREADACIAGLTSANRPASWVADAAHWLRGLVAEARGVPAVALQHLDRAIDSSDLGLPFYQGHMLVDHARLAARLGRRTAADGSLARAESIYRRLGAAAYLDKVTDLRGGPAVPQQPWAGPGLTDREQDVLTLVVAGLSYVQIAKDLFITRSTVGYHLSNIYAKTGVASRHQLTEAVRRDPATFAMNVAVAAARG